VLIALLVIYLTTQLASSWVSAVNVQDKTQRRLLFLFPIVFSFVIIRFPAGLIVYWITTNLWTIGQQLVIRRFMPTPALHPAGAGAGAGAGGGGGGLGGLLGGGRSGDGGGGGLGGLFGGGRSGDGGGKPARAGVAAERPKSRGKASSSEKSSGDGGNGRPTKAPPPSPRKKKKRSGRRR
jgi:YidC/Oxa1 family membrane protein insertase